MNSGYHAWLLQKGTIKIPVLFSSLIFLRTFGIREKGGKAYQKKSFQLMVNALMEKASGSLCQEQNLLHFAFILVAKRSISVLPNLLHIALYAEFDSSHSVSKFDILEPSSATFSFVAT